MKSLLVNRVYKYLFILLSFTCFYSCGYEEVANAEYPEDQVYIAGVYESMIYKINQITEKENAPFRYKIDLENNKLIIPLSIYRSSIKSEINTSVQLGIDNDTIPKLIESGILLGENGSVPDILPEGKYELNTGILIQKGEELGKFDLKIDIPFLLENLDKRFVLGIKIINSNTKINDKMSLIVVDILAAFIDAYPNFTFQMNDAQPLEVAFTNTSNFCLSYEWDFGDGSPVLNIAEPLKHTFPGVGIYTVKLTSKGTRGNLVTTTKIVHIWEDVTANYIKNPGNPFKKAGLVSGRVDVLQDWKYTQNVLSTYSSATKIYVGGYQGDNGGVMDFYANSGTGGALKNAKIYQTLTSLPAGLYNAGFIPFSFTNENDCYFVVTRGDSLPDIENITTDTDIISYYHWNKSIDEMKYGVEFNLDSPQNVTIGFVVSNVSGARVKIKSVFLSK